MPGADLWWQFFIYFRFILINQQPTSSISPNPYVALANSYEGRLFHGPLPSLASQVKSSLEGQRHLVLEIGSGSGGHLLKRALHNPNLAFLGIEPRFKRAVRTIQKAQTEGIDNVFVLREKLDNIWHVIFHLRFQQVFINFPEPWPKRRDWKHRLLSNEHLGKLAKLMVKGAALELKTDNLPYFNWVCQQATNCEELDVLEKTSYQLSDEEWKENTFRSEFESLFYHQNLPTNFLKLERT